MKERVTIPNPYKNVTQRVNKILDHLRYNSVYIYHWSVTKNNINLHIGCSGLTPQEKHAMIAELKSIAHGNDIPNLSQVA